MREIYDLPTMDDLIKLGIPAGTEILIRVVIDNGEQVKFQICNAKTLQELGDIPAEPIYRGN